MDRRARSASPTRAPAQPAYLRTEFDVASAKSRVRPCTRPPSGVYQVALNGTDVDDQVMKPGWTPYNVPHDPRDDRCDRPARRGAQRDRRAGLAGAWGTERFGFRENARLIYGDQPRFAAQLLVEYADGAASGS